MIHAPRPAKIQTTGLSYQVAKMAQIILRLPEEPWSN
jgi:hypothetical protein